MANYHWFPPIFVAPTPETCDVQLGVRLGTIRRLQFKRLAQEWKRWDGQLRPANMGSVTVTSLIGIPIGNRIPYARAKALGSLS